MRTGSKPGAERSSAAAVAAMIGTIAALYFLREILIPLAFALTFTFLLTPAVTLFERLRLRRVPSVIVTLLVAITVAAWAGWIIGNQLVGVANELPTYRENIHAKIQAFNLSQKGPLGRAAASVQEIAQELSSPEPSPSSPAASRQNPKRAATPSPQSPMPVQVVEAPGNGLSYLRSFGESFIRPVALTGMIIIFTIFMLVEREDLRNRVLRLAGITQLNVMTQALDDAAKRVSRYLLMQFLVNASFGVVIGTGLYFIGLPAPALWGVLAGILRMVPYVGTLVAAGMPVLLSLAVFNGWVSPLLVFLLFLVIEPIVANVVEPWLYGTHTGISSLALLVSAVFWTVLWGPAGLVLSTPLTVCLVVLGRYFPELSFLHVILGDEPVLEVEAQLYQRLLAMDQVEARSIIDHYLKSKPLIELYDEVLIPALNMAEQDRHRGAIDVAREEFLFLSVNEMVAEFFDNKPEVPPHSEGNGAAPKAIRRNDRRIICLPAHDEADEIAGAMLGQILEQAGYPVLVMPLAHSLHETVAILDVGPSDVVCVSALPPYAFAPSRAICNQLRASYPKLTIVVCVWGFAGDTNKAMARFERGQPQQIVTSIGQAVELIHNLDQLVALEPVSERV